MLLLLLFIFLLLFVRLFTIYIPTMYCSVVNSFYLHNRNVHNFDTHKKRKGSLKVGKIPKFF